MKKIICLVFCVLLLCCFAGCENNRPSTNKATTSANKTSCGHDSCAQNGPFYCMGKNDTCPNKTYCAYDFYCSSCD